jgi:hypothetical protein
MSPNKPMQKPAPATSFSAVITRNFSTLTQRGGGPITIKVDGEVVKPGAHSAQVLGLLGIVPEEIDDAFWKFVGNGHWPLISEGTTAMFDEFAARDQHGAGWKIEANVRPGAGVTEVRDLAYVDAREVSRWLTLTVRDHNKLSYKEYAENGFDASVGRTSWLTSQSQSIEPGGAVGSWYSGVDQGEIDATRSAANALYAARRDLRNARDEMEVAIRVADAAWKGDRAEAMKYKLCLETTAVEAVLAVTHAWEDFTQDVVRQQGLAKEHDDKLKREVATEIGITVVVGIITFGAGAALKGAAFAAKLAKWARDVEVLRKAMESRHGATLTRIAQHTGTVRLLRASKLGTIEVGATAGVKGATGQELTAEELLMRFMFAAGIQAGSDLWRFGLGPMGQRYGVTFRPPSHPATPPRTTPPVRPTTPAPRTPVTNPVRPTVRPNPGPGGRVTNWQAVRNARADAAATNFQRRPELKLDQGADTRAALVQIFRRTLGGGRSNPRPGRVGQHYPLHSRAHAAEIRSVRATAARPEVERIAAIPSAAGGRSPDFVVYTRQADGTLAASRLEITTVTGAGNRYVPRGPVASTPTTTDDVVSAVKGKVEVPAGSHNQLTYPITLPGGTTLPTGGTLAVHLPQLTSNGRTTVADAMRRLGPTLANRAEVQRLEFYLPGHQAPIVFTRQANGTYI